MLFTQCDKLWELDIIKIQYDYEKGNLEFKFFVNFLLYTCFEKIINTWLVVVMSKGSKFM